MDKEHLLALALTLIEDTALGAALSEIDARPVPDIVRMFHIHELLEAVFPKIWEGLPLQEQLGADDAEAVRDGLFAALCLIARARGGKRRRKVAWTRFGDEPASGSPAEVSEKDVGYALVHDPSCETAVYISGSSSVTFGQTWEWRDGGWKARAIIEHAVDEPHNQGFRGFYDPSRQGIACWTLVAQEPAQFERYRPLGLLVGPDGVTLIETRDTPVVPSEMLFVFGAIFGVDPASGDTIMLARDALYALRGDAWVKLAELAPNATSREWWPDSRASFEHQGELYFTWTDKDDFATRCRLLRFTGHGVQELRPRNAPDSGSGAFLSDGTGARFVREGKQWRLAGSGNELSWQEVESALELPEYRRAWGAVLPGGEILIGPGDHADSSGDTRYQRCFLHVRGEQIARLGEALEGVGVCPPDRTLLGHRDRVLAVYADGRVDGVRGGVCERLAEPLPGVTLALAGVCLDGDGRVMAVASDASVWRLGPEGWQRMGEPDAEVARWTLRCCAWDPPRDRLVIWGFDGDADSRLAERTAVWASGSFSRLEAGSVLPAGDKFLRGDLDNQMVFDTHHQAVVFVGAKSICLLDGDRWHPSEPGANIYRGASSGSALLLHDEGSATTLFIDTKDGWCGRLDGGNLEMVGRLRAPPDKLVTFAGSAEARRAAMVYVPASCSVLVYASGASYDQFWELPLADILAATVPGGERKEFARSDPSEKRFTGPRPRRLEAAPARPRVSGDASGGDGDNLVRFRRFGQEPPTDWSLPTQTSDELLLAFDRLRQRPILLRSGYRAVECWHKRGDQVWELLHQSEGGPFRATTRVSSDPRRGAVLWYVDDRHGTVGYRITDEGLLPISTSGDGPARSEDFDHRDKVAFVWDRREDRILVCSTEGLWALDHGDRWSRLATWDGPTPLHQVGRFRERDGGAWDALGERLVMWRLDYSDGLCCWRVSDAGIEPMDEAHLDDASGCLIAESDAGLLLYNGSRRTLARLEASGWVELDAGQGAPELDSSPDAVMACHAAGTIDSAIEIASWRPFQFHTREQSSWRSAGQPSGVERPRGATLLGRHHGRLLVSDGLSAWLHDGERWAPLDNLMEVFFEVSWRNEVGHMIGMVAIADGDGPARVLCESGVVATLTDQGWDLQRPRGDLPNRDGYYERVAAFCPTDSSWLLVIRNGEHAVTFRGTHDGHWEEVCQLPFSDQLAPYTTRQLVFDTRLDCFVLAGSDGVLHLRDRTWVRVHIDALPECDRLFHDRETGATLLIQVGEGKVYRLGASGVTELSRVIGPPVATRQRAVRDLPSARDTLVDVTGRRLVWLDSQDVWGNYELDLAGYIEQARALGTMDP